MTARKLFAVGLALAVLGVVGPAHGRPAAATVCVGGPGCFPTLQSGIDAARPGDTVNVQPGVYAGGIRILKDVTVVGADARTTVIKGGGPVIVIFDIDQARDLHVTLRGLTITGGRNFGDRTWTEARNDVQAPWGVGGGGIFIGAVNQKATSSWVSLIDCVVTRNISRPTQVKSASDPFAGAEGGGIDSVGKLTLIRTTVSDNVTGGGVTGRAEGGGIRTAAGYGHPSLTIRDSRIVNNSAIVSRRLGPDHAEGGGIEGQDGLELSISNSVISGNRVVLDTREPPHAANENGYWASAAGLEVGGFGSATITSTRITDNVTRVVDPVGEANVGGAVLVGGPKEKLVVRDVTVAGNRVEATLASVTAGPPNCCPGGVVEIDSAGDVRGLRIVHNTQILRVRRRLAILGGTLWSVNGEKQPLVIADSLISGNVVIAIDRNGAAWAFGGGIANAGFMVLRRTRVSGNVVRSSGRSGWARGGGIWNDVLPGNKPPRLTLGSGTVVTGNVLGGGRNQQLAGGGLFTTRPVTRRGVRLRRNSPNDCGGC